MNKHFPLSFVMYYGFLVLQQDMHHRKQIDDGRTDDRHIGGFGSGEISLGEDIVPVDRLTQDEKATGKRC